MKNKVSRNHIILGLILIITILFKIARVEVFCAVGSFRIWWFWIKFHVSIIGITVFF